jgi:hypothetical protein
MSTETTEAKAPPIGDLASEMVATLCMAGLAYLEQADVDSAVVACDLGGSAFERISSSLGPEERTSLGELVTQLRLSIVRKRGSS